MTSLDSCNLCGKCNSVCAVFRMTKKERFSNRHKVFLAMKKVKNDNLFRVLLDGTAESICPAGIDVDEEVIKMRAFLVDHNIETLANKEMIKNIRVHGNPYGK
jgi:Fe-S oxidoreductase